MSIALQATTSYGLAGRLRPAGTAPRQLIAVDARNYILSVYYKHAARLVEDDDVAAHLPDLVAEAALGFVRNNHAKLPFFVLDGKPPRAKAATIQQRRRDSEASLARVREAQRAEPVPPPASPGSVAPQEMPPEGGLGTVEPEPPTLRQALEKPLIRKRHGFPRKHFELITGALRVAGFPVVQAPGEAEAQAAFWARRGTVYAVATRDADAFLHGAPRVCRSFPYEASYVRLADVIKHTGARSLRDLVEASVIAGETDYAPCLPGIKGLRHALLRLQYKGFEGLLEEAGGDATQWMRARDLFVKPVIDEHLDPSALAWALPGVS